MVKTKKKIGLRSSQKAKAEKLRQRKKVKEAAADGAKNREI